MMPRTIKFAAVILSTLLTVVCMYPKSAAADLPDALSSRRLEKRMNEIIALQRNIDHKTTQAQELYRRLKDQLVLVVAEIRDECRQHGIDSYEQAVRWQALDHRLSLAQQLFSYMDALDRKIRSFKNGYQRLGFFYQEAVDDLKVIQALPSLDIGNFMATTHRAIEQFRRELQGYLVDSGNIVYVHTPRIWKLVVEDQTGASHAGPG